jgi:hypothetical protein
MFDHIHKIHGQLLAVCKDPNNTFYVASKDHYKDGPSRLQGVASQYASSRFMNQGAG